MAKSEVTELINGCEQFARQLEALAEKITKAEEEFVAAVAKATTCKWQRAEGDFNQWDTECGKAFYFTDGTPSDNGARFCIYCGKKIVSEPIEADESLQAAGDDHKQGPGYVPPLRPPGETQGTDKRY